MRKKTAFVGDKDGALLLQQKSTLQTHEIPSFNMLSVQWGQHSKQIKSARAGEKGGCGGSKDPRPSHPEKAA